MADFSALKTSIQNYIKQNGNEEITGNLLQQILLSMVTTLGDSAINDLVTALNAEIANRGNADTTLQGNIDNEATARGNADTELGGRITTLQGIVNGIVANIENGYVYAGIATPSTTPASGKVFYLALTAGTYTNFGATVVPQGINILKYNGSAWSLDSFLGLDDAPTQGSSNLVKSGGVLDSIIKDGSAFDLSAYNNGTTYADLPAALTALNALPAAYKKGGMSFKYVQTSDNKYVLYRLMSDTFNTTVANWQSVNADDMPTEGSENLVKSGGVQKITGSIGVMYDNNSLSLQNLQKSYYGEFKAGKKISLKALNVTLAGSGWYNIALRDCDEDEYIIVLNQPTNGVYEEITLERDCTHLRVDINASENRTTCDIDYCLEYNLLTESTKAELTSLQKKQIALSKGIILSSENNYAKIEQILLFNAYSSNSTYKSLMLGVVDKNGSVYGIQMFDSGNLIDNGDFTATINGTIAHIKGWLNKGIAYIDAYFDTETYVQIASINSGLIIPLQDATLLNEQATPYDSSILTESGLMNSQGVVGDTSFHHSPKISLDGVSDIWLTTKMVTTDSNYARIVFFKGNEVTNAYPASSGGVTSAAFRKGIHWQDADSFVVNCYNSSFSDFSMTVCKNTLTETENILNTHIRHNTPYIVDASGNGDFSSLTEAVTTLKDINDVTLLVNNGTYNLISEFETLYGSDFFTNYPLTEPPLNKRGIVLNNRVKIIFSSNSKVTCNYAGSNTGVMKYFSPFNAGKYGFELIGLNLECSNVRYGIHDERYNGGDNANTDDYTNIYRYCSIKLDNRNSQGLGTNQCIGGGLGYQGNIIIEGCYFESQVSNDSIVSYHNHAKANSKSKIVANNNYIAGTNGFRFSWYGASTLITDIFLSGNSVGKATVVSAETQDATINNINVTEWNTNLRN